VIDYAALRKELTGYANVIVKKGLCERTQVSIDDRKGTARNIHSGELLAYVNPWLWSKADPDPSP